MERPARCQLASHMGKEIQVTNAYVKKIDGVGHWLLYGIEVAELEDRIDHVWVQVGRVKGERPVVYEGATIRFRGIVTDYLRAKDGTTDYSFRPDVRAVEVLRRGRWEPAEWSDDEPDYRDDEHFAGLMPPIRETAPAPAQPVAPALTLDTIRAVRAAVAQIDGGPAAIRRAAEITALAEPFGGLSAFADIAEALQG